MFTEKRNRKCKRSLHKKEGFYSEDFKIYQWKHGYIGEKMKKTEKGK